MMLSRRVRRATLLAHILVSLAWVGVDLVIGVFAITGITSDDPATIAMSYTALEAFALVLLVPLGLLSLGTGVLLGLGTRHGLVRYWWVLVKLVLTIVLVVLVLTALRSTLADAASASQVADASLTDRLGRDRVSMLFPPAVSTTVLVVVAVLGFYKPWGPTPRGRRFLRAGTAGTADRTRVGQGV